MSEQQTTDEQPQKRQRHGLTPAKKAIRKYGTGALDQRTGPDLDVYVYETEFDGICDFQGATENKPESFSCSL